MPTEAQRLVAQEVLSPSTFTIRNLSVLAYAQGFTLWHYKGGTLPMAEMRAVGFFNSSADMLATGDMILMSAADGGAVSFVAKSDGGAVILAGVV